MNAVSLTTEGAALALPSGRLCERRCDRGEGLLELGSIDVTTSAPLERVPSGSMSESSSSCRVVPARGVRVASSRKRTCELLPRGLVWGLEATRGMVWEWGREWDWDDEGEDGPAGDRTSRKGALTRDSLQTRIDLASSALRPTPMFLV